jgi:hypothetical protein
MRGRSTNRDRIKLLFIMDRAAAERTGFLPVPCDLPEEASMRDVPFDTSVTVKAGRPRVVRSTVQAAFLLVDRWPDKDRGPEYRSALQACMDVMEGRRAAASARRAFIRAAKEASLFVREGKARHH